MPRFKPKGVFEQSAAADLWKHTLARIPTAYGRLVYLASLRDANSGIYRHHGLSVTFGREESTKALRESHEQVFAEWLSLPLEEKGQDLRSYLNSMDEPGLMVVSHWLNSRSYRFQAPSSALPMERELFSQDLDALLQVFRNGFAGAQASLDSLPPT